MFMFKIFPICNSPVLVGLIWFGLMGSTSDTVAAEPTTALKSKKQNAADVQIDRNVRYSVTAGKFGYCDLYRPSLPVPELGYPVVLVVHGGGWTSGDKWTLERYCRSLAGVGIASVSINYRLAPADKFPKQLDDVRAAMLWIKKQSIKRSFDTDRLGLFGYSAGGHLVLLAASLADESIQNQSAASDWPIDDPRWERLPTISAVCAGGPPCDFETLPIDNTTMAYFLGGSRRDKPTIYQAASPMAHVSKADPATKIIQGDSDILVPIKGSRAFYTRQKDAGVVTDLTVIEGQGHLMTFLNPKTCQLMVDFFRIELAVTD